MPVPPGLFPEWERNRTRWFKRGSTLDLLDLGVARGDISRFIALCAGAGGRRPIDLLLAGHAHRRADYRLDWDSAANEPRYYFDFYFGQPSNYYRARMVAVSDPVWIEVVPGATPNGQPQTQSTTAPALPYLAVPPNPDNFAAATHPDIWWRSNRPFVCQTAATGPIETYQRLEQGKPRRGPTFRGFRYGHVDQSALVDFHYLPLDAASAAGYWRSGLPPSLRPCWLRATTPPRR